jgi:AcrR family transcriptional regulator
MGLKDRRARQKQALRGQILDAARDILVTQGFGGLSMRKVADRIEYSPTAIYLHFHDKQSLVAELCEETFVRLVRELETLPSEFKDPLVCLRRGLQRYVRFGLKYPQHYLAAFVIPNDVAKDDEARERMQSPQASGMRALGILRQIVAECVRLKKLRAVDIDVATRALWAGVHGITSLLIVYEHFPWGDRDAVVTTLIDAMIAGLKRAG